jgi:hypothetical protein
MELRASRRECDSLKKGWSDASGVVKETKARSEPVSLWRRDLFGSGRILI